MACRVILVCDSRANGEPGHIVITSFWEWRLLLRIAFDGRPQSARRRPRHAPFREKKFYPRADGAGHYKCWGCEDRPDEPAQSRGPQQLDRAVNVGLVFRGWEIIIYAIAPGSTAYDEHDALVMYSVGSLRNPVLMGPCFLRGNPNGLTLVG